MFSQVPLVGVQSPLSGISAEACERIHAVDFGPDGAARRAKVARRDGGLSCLIEDQHTRFVDQEARRDFGETGVTALRAEMETKPWQKR